MELIEVRQLINCLTNNEDSRQDLWVHYLSGNSIESFADYLQDIANDMMEEDDVKQALWGMFKEPPSDKFYELLADFTDFEQSIICLLMLGLSVPQITRYKGISEVRLCQTISSIKQSTSWERLYGFKEKTDGGRKIRSE